MVHSLSTVAHVVISFSHVFPLYPVLGSLPAKDEKVYVLSQRWHFGHILASIPQQQQMCGALPPQGGAQGPVGELRFPVLHLCYPHSHFKNASVRTVLASK